MFGFGKKKDEGPEDFIQVTVEVSQWITERQAKKLVSKLEGVMEFVTPYTSPSGRSPFSRNLILFKGRDLTEVNVLEGISRRAAIQLCTSSKDLDKVKKILKGYEVEFDLIPPSSVLNHVAHEIQCHHYYYRAMSNLDLADEGEIECPECECEEGYSFGRSCSYASHTSDFSIDDHVPLFCGHCDTVNRHEVYSKTPREVMDYLLELEEEEKAARERINEH